MAYQDNDDDIRIYNYTLGKAIGVAGGMVHSTGVGPIRNTRCLVMCPCWWQEQQHMEINTQDNISDELEHHQHPFKGFIRNEYLEGRKSKCQ
jgi:hypothetical protein